MAQVKSFQEYIEKNFLAKLEQSAEEYLYDHAGVLQVEREKDITLRDIDFSEAEVHRVWTEDSPGNAINFAVIVRARYQGYGGDNKYGEPDDYEEWIQMDCEGNLSKDLRDFRVLNMSEYDYINKPKKTLSGGLVPYMKRTELESYAKRLLDEFWPELYKDQIPIEPKVLAERMGLKVFEHRLTSDLSVFGEMIFSSSSEKEIDERGVSSKSYGRLYTLMWLSKLPIFEMIVCLNPVTTATDTTMMTMARIMPTTATFSVETAERLALSVREDCSLLAMKSSSLMFVALSCAKVNYFDVVVKNIYRSKQLSLFLNKIGCVSAKQFQTSLIVLHSTFAIFAKFYSER